MTPDPALPRAGADANGEAPPARRRELEVLAVVLVSQILDREDQAELIPAPRERARPSRAAAP